MKIGKLKWLYHRLKAMSISEIIFRIYEKLKIKIYKIKFKQNINILQMPIKNLNLMNISSLNNKLDSIWNFSEVDVENSSDLIINVFNKKINLDNNYSWHGFNEKKWNKDIFSCNIDFKNRDDIGEIRLIWEFNRHLFLPYLLLKSKKYNNNLYYEKAKFAFYDWINNNYYLKGINWSSPMEIAIRSYQWMICYSIIKDNDDKAFKNDLLTAIIISIEYVSKNFSRFSSANNHLILESGIVSIIGYLVKDIYNQEWFEKGYKILDFELKRQFYEDGVNREHATHYHGFVVDLWLQYNVFLKSFNIKTLHEDILFKAVEFIGYLKYSNNNFIEFGDSDDAKIINLTGKEYNYYDYLLELGSKYFKIELINNSINNETCLWKNINVLDEIKLFEYKKENLYNESGYYIYKTNKMYVFFDIADLGFGSISAHGHADCLSIVLSFENNPIFIDPGTYIYNVEKKYRDYFRKTSVHNTLSYKGTSQSVMEGPFLWSKKAKVVGKGYYDKNDYLVIYGSHDGYNPFIHKRTIYISKIYNLIIVKDEFKGSNSFINFTLDDKVNVSEVNGYKYKVGNKLYFYSNNLIKLERKLISKEFLVKKETNSLVIDLADKNTALSIISDENYLKIKEGLIYRGDSVIFNY